MMFCNDTAAKVAALDILVEKFCEEKFGKDMTKLLPDSMTIHLMGSEHKQDPIAINAMMNTAIKCRAFVV